MDNKVIELILELLKNQGKVNKDLPFEVGKNYFIRTVTYHLTGHLEKIVGDFLIFSDAAWIADSGRFTQAMSRGIDKNENAEIEPWGNDVFVNIYSIVDGTEYKNSLPKEQK